MLKFLSSFLAPTTRTAARKSAPKARLRLEMLEDRTVPTSLPVTNTSEGSIVPYSLGWDLAYINMMHNSSNTLTFDSGLYGTIDVPGTLDLSLNVLIDGNGTNVAIAGDGSFGIFQIATSATVTLKDIEITDGGGNLGGGIYSTGTLTLNHVSIDNCNATVDGGGIYNWGTLSMTQSSVTHNSAPYGGGIYNKDTLTINDSNTSISYNTSSGNGAGIYSVSGTVTLSGYVKINHNTATNFGGGVFVLLGSFSMTGGEIDDNSGKDGGGVFAHVDVSLDSLELVNNSASRNGGGVYQDAGTMTCTDCYFYSNTAATTGAAGSWSAGATITRSGCSGQTDFQQA